MPAGNPIDVHGSPAHVIEDPAVGGRDRRIAELVGAWRPLSVVERHLHAQRIERPPIGAVPDFGMRAEIRQMLDRDRSEEHTSDPHSLMCISYDALCSHKITNINHTNNHHYY